MIKPGIYDNISNEAYHADTDYMSKSGADLIEKAPILYKHRYIDKTPQETTKALIDGTRTHLFTLEPEKVQKTYYHLQADHKGTTKAGKEHLKIAETGLEPIKHTDWTLYQGMADAVRSHKYAAALLQGALIESSIFWRDFVTATPCKCRPDILRPDIKVCCDFKTTVDASYEAFRKSIYNFRYHVQGAHYLDGASTTGTKYDKFVIIAVEKKPPHLVAVYQLDEDALRQGRYAIERNLRTYQECKASGVWPGYEEKVQLIELPGWAKE